MSDKKDTVKQVKEEALKEESKEAKFVVDIIKRIEALESGLSAYRRECMEFQAKVKMLVPLLAEAQRRIGALEHPDLHEPLLAFQKLRAALEKINQANIDITVFQS